MLNAMPLLIMSGWLYTCQPDANALVSKMCICAIYQAERMAIVTQALCVNDHVQKLKSVTAMNERCFELQKPQPKKRSSSGAHKQVSLTRSL